MIFAPIILFVYNRPIHTRRTVEALRRNWGAENSDLFVYCDGPKVGVSKSMLQQIEDVRNYVETIEGFKSIHIVKRESNMGLDPSEIEAVTEIINIYGKVIVVEDDIVTAPYFLRFMNEALEFYESDGRIAQIGGCTDAIKFPDHYKHDVFVSYRSESWGWGTWKDRWNQVDWDFHNYRILKHPYKWRVNRFNRGGDDLFYNLTQVRDGITDAWDARWQNYMYEHNGLCVRSVRSFVLNIGFDGTGVHCGNVGEEKIQEVTAPFYNEDVYSINFVKQIRVNSNLQKTILEFYRWPTIPLYKQIKWKIKDFVRFIYKRCSRK